MHKPEARHLVVVPLISAVKHGVRGVFIVELTKDAHAFVKDALNVVWVQNVVGLLYLCQTVVVMERDAG